MFKIWLINIYNLNPTIQEVLLLITLGYIMFDSQTPMKSIYVNQRIVYVNESKNWEKWLNLEGKGPSRGREKTSNHYQLYQSIITCIMLYINAQKEWKTPKIKPTS